MEIQGQAFPRDDRERQGVFMGTSGIPSDDSKLKFLLSPLLAVAYWILQHAYSIIGSTSLIMRSRYKVEKKGEPNNYVLLDTENGNKILTDSYFNTCKWRTEKGAQRHADRLNAKLTY